MTVHLPLPKSAKSRQEIFPSTSTSASSSDAAAATTTETFGKPLDPIFNSYGLARVGEAVRNARRVVVISGAGISTPAIPDFRSASGLFKTLGEEGVGGIKSGKELFNVRCLSDPNLLPAHHNLLTRLHELSSTTNPTDFHNLLKRIDKEGRLLRCYTQNIDGLERKAGLDLRVPEVEERKVYKRGRKSTAGVNKGKEVDRDGDVSMMSQQEEQQGQGESSFIGSSTIPIPNPSSSQNTITPEDFPISLSQSTSQPQTPSRRPSPSTPSRSRVRSGSPTDQSQSQQGLGFEHMYPFNPSQSTTYSPMKVTPPPPVASTSASRLVTTPQQYVSPTGSSSSGRRQRGMEMFEEEETIEGEIVLGVRGTASNPSTAGLDYRFPSRPLQQQQQQQQQPFHRTESQRRWSQTVGIEEGDSSILTELPEEQNQNQPQGSGTGASSSSSSSQDRYYSARDDSPVPPFMSPALPPSREGWENERRHSATSASEATERSGNRKGLGIPPPPLFNLQQQQQQRSQIQQKPSYPSPTFSSVSVETAAPIPHLPRCVPLHGLLDVMHCTLCSYSAPIEEHIPLLETPIACPACERTQELRVEKSVRVRSTGVLRAGVVLYGEEHRHGEAIGAIVEKDINGTKLEGKMDLLIVAGTTFHIPGVKRMIKEFSKVLKSDPKLAGGGGKKKRKSAAGRKESDGTDEEETEEEPELDEDFPIRTIYLNMDPPGKGKGGAWADVFDVWVQGDLQEFTKDWVINGPRNPWKPTIHRELAAGKLELQERQQKHEEKKKNKIVLSEPQALPSNFETFPLGGYDPRGYTMQLKRLSPMKFKIKKEAAVMASQGSNSAAPVSEIDSEKEVFDGGKVSKGKKRKIQDEEEGNTSSLPSTPKKSKSGRPQKPSAKLESAKKRAASQVIRKKSQGTPRKRKITNKAQESSSSGDDSFSGSGPARQFKFAWEEGDDDSELSEAPEESPKGSSALPKLDFMAKLTAPTRAKPGPKPKSATATLAATESPQKTKGKAGRPRKSLGSLPSSVAPSTAASTATPPPPYVAQPQSEPEPQSDIITVSSVPIRKPSIKRVKKEQPQLPGSNVSTPTSSPASTPPTSSAAQRGLKRKSNGILNFANVKPSGVGRGVAGLGNAIKKQRSIVDLRLPTTPVATVDQPQEQEEVHDLIVVATPKLAFVGHGTEVVGAGSEERPSSGRRSARIKASSSSGSGSGMGFPTTPSSTSITA